MNAKTKKLLFICCEVVLAAVAFIMLFLPVIGIKDTDTTYTGLNVAFGYSTKVILAEVKVLEFSFMNLLTYILVVAAAVLAVLKLFMKDTKVLTLVIAALLIVAGVFFFLTVQFTNPNTNASNVIKAIGGDIRGGLTLAYGSYIGGIAAILGGAVACCEFLVVKK